ncbi:hypothetical protein BH11ARM1_BH11ARM1_18310 [soil metagenome]
MTLNYRGWRLGAVLIFMWIWTLGWNAGVLMGWNSPNVHINGRLASSEEAHNAMFFFLAIGLLVGLGTLWATCYFFFNRIIVDENEVRAYNSFNVLKFQAPRSQVSIELASAARNRYRITAGDQSFYLSSAINNFNELGLDDPSTTASKPYQKPLLPTTDTTYNFRKPMIYVVLAVIAISALVLPLVSRNPFSVVSPLFILGFLGLKTLNERIVIGPDGIRYYNLFGKLKTTATLAEIEGVRTSAGSKSTSIYIETKNGTILISGFPESAKIRSQINLIVGK